MAVADISQWALRASAGKQTRSGSVAVALVDSTKEVTFSEAMPSANYTVLFERGGVTATVLTVSSKTVSGFTINLSVAVNETVKWLAVED